MGKYFGTDGFRGEAGITLTADHAYKVGRFLSYSLLHNVPDEALSCLKRHPRNTDKSLFAAH